MDPAALEYVEAEFTEVIFGLYALLSRAYWINNLFSTRIAHRKLLQLGVNFYAERRVNKVRGFSTTRSVVFAFRSVFGCRVGQ